MEQCECYDISLAVLSHSDMTVGPQLASSTNKGSRKGSERINLASKIGGRLVGSIIVILYYPRVIIGGEREFEVLDEKCCLPRWASGCFCVF